MSDNLRAMMLLVFGGLDSKEQVSVLSSVNNNEYDFGKISHAMRIQFPSAAEDEEMMKHRMMKAMRPVLPHPTMSWWMPS